MTNQKAAIIRGMEKLTIAIATKNYKTVECKTWEQIAKYQNRGWAITLTKEYLMKEATR